MIIFPPYHQTFRPPAILLRKQPRYFPIDVDHL
jgi:hypothetical protein